MILSILMCVGLLDLTPYELATWQVETGKKEGMIWGDWCPRKKEYRSLGPLQISRAAHADALEYDPSIGGTWHDVANIDYAIKINRAYLARYCNERRLGRKPTDFDRARTWVGGPRGPWRESSIPYAKRVTGLIK